MKKILGIVIASLFITSSAFALTWPQYSNTTRRIVDHRPIMSPMISNSTGFLGSTTAGNVPGLATAPSLIYSVTLVATGANASLSLFDSPIAEFGEYYNSAWGSYIWVEPIWECEIASMGNTYSVSFSDPLPTFTGLSVTVTNGNAYIEYE